MLASQPLAQFSHPVHAVGAALPAGMSVWRLQLDRLLAAQLPGEHELDAKTVTAIRQTHRPEFAARRLATAAWMRSLIAGQLGCSVRNLRLGEDHNGKPKLLDPDGRLPHLTFNLSHCADAALLVLDDHSRAVGVDIEQPLARRDLNRLAPQFLTAAEHHRIAAIAQPQLELWLLQHWSAKEALAKAWGLGLNAGLQHIAVDAEQGFVLQQHGCERAPDGQWQILQLDVPQPFVGFVAFDSSP
ncbi:MAG: 4'-phosphopantetheinyl transferase superfamily protein [Myxococcales bacterium]|nr:4'-phosphopantetheinyl transferase superfamily protein [Myxococcales bacterium]